MPLRYRRRTRTSVGVQSPPGWQRSHHARCDRDESRNYALQISSPIPVRAPASPAPAYSDRSSAGWPADAVLPLLGAERFDAIDSGGMLALVLFGHAAHCQQAGRLRFHQALLQVVNGPFVTTLAGLSDLLLHAHHLLLQGAPGQAAPRGGIWCLWWTLVTGCFPKW